MALLAVIIVCVLVVTGLTGAAVVYNRYLETRLKRMQDSLKTERNEAKQAPQKDTVTRDEINKVFAEMQASNKKALTDFSKSMASITPTPTRSAGGGGGGGGTDTRSIKDDLERYNTTLTNKIVQQERALKNSIISYTTNIVQQEQLINAIRSVNTQQDNAIKAIRSGTTQQEQLSATIRSIQDINVRQEAVINRLLAVQQEAPRQIQADDLAKRANLMAIAYYNAIRDKTPGQKLQWDILLKHMYVCGFVDPIYKEQKLLMETYFTIVDSMPYQKRTRCIDVVSYLIEYISKYIPYNNNPKGLRLFELELDKNNGTAPSLANTQGALNPQAAFFPPDLPDPQVGIDRGPQAMYIVLTASQQAKKLLDDAVAASAVS